VAGLSVCPDTFDLLKAVAQPPKPGQPYARLNAADRALVEEKLLFIEAATNQS
jgi:hypothetical protein